MLHPGEWRLYLGWTSLRVLPASAGVSSSMVRDVAQGRGCALCLRMPSRSKGIAYLLVVIPDWGTLLIPMLEMSVRFFWTFIVDFGFSFLFLF